MPYADPAKLRDYLKEYRQRNADKARKRAADWRKSNPERNAASIARWNALRAKPRKALSVEERRKRATKKMAAWRAKNRCRSNAISAKSKSKNKPNATALQAKRKAQQLRSIPKWADMLKIGKFYIEAAATGHTVDHIVPLQSKLVCGLHCEDNLQLLPRGENSSKGNREWPYMP